jgi:hypothetical protein
MGGMTLSWGRGSNDKAKMKFLVPLMPPHSPEMRRKISETSTWLEELGTVFIYTDHEAGH